METKLKLIFVIYTGLLCSAVCLHIRQIQYKPGNRQFSTEEKDCCLRKFENKYKAVKIPLCNESEICYGLDHDWLLDKHYDNGYYYIEKEKVVDIFQPPIPMSTDRYYWTLPISFEAGAIITIFFTSPVSWTRFDINLYDTIKDNLFPLQYKPVMHHIYFQHDYHAGVDAYTPEKGWHLIGLTRPCPLELGKTSNLTFESHTSFIRTVINGDPYFDFPHITPPMNAATLEIVPVVKRAPFLLHNITMNGRVKKNFTSFT